MRIMRLWAVSMLMALVPISVAGQTVFSDDFEYAVGREDSDKDTPFSSGGGYYDVKSRPTDTGARGYLYTATTSGVPGNCGAAFPGTSSSRVLVAEALASTYSGQTDFYLQIGNNTTDYIPGDVWIQFWVCPISSGSMLSDFGPQSKFLYVSKTGFYPSSNHSWLVGAGSQIHMPNMLTNGQPLGNPTSNDGMFINMVGSSLQSSANYSLADPGDEGQIGVTDLDDYVPANTWMLIKMRMRTTATGANDGNRWEMWARAYGNQTWEKWAEWIADGSTTPNFTWAINSGYEGGHSSLKLFTTWETYDAYVAMDDFVIAETEGDLPTYQDSGGGSSGPVRIRIVGAALGWLLVAGVVPWHDRRRRRTP